MAASDLNPDPEHLRAELAKVRAETELLEAQNRKARAEMDAKFQLDLKKLIAETRQTEAETRKTIRETFWYPAFIGASLFGGGGVVFVGLVKLWEIMKL